jgi:chromate transporter
MDSSGTAPVQDAPAQDAPVRLADLCRAFALIGVSSFGGGMSGWLYREIVENRRWMSAQEFLAGLTLSRAMPGVNVMNQSIWIGYRLRKTPGAVIAATSVLAGPIAIIVILALLYRFWIGSPITHPVLLGVAAAGIGMTLSAGLQSARAGASSPFYAAMVALVFVGVGLLRWPILPVVAVLAPASIAWASFVERSDEN